MPQRAHSDTQIVRSGYYHVDKDNVASEQSIHS